MVFESFFFISWGVLSDASFGKHTALEKFNNFNDVSAFVELGEKISRGVRFVAPPARNRSTQLCLHCDRLRTHTRSVNYG